jgi:AraC family transcriptional regulator
MQTMQVEENVARKFGLEQAPTLLAQRQLARPIAFTRLRATGSASGRTMAAPPDAAFVLLVALAPMSAGEIWIDGKHGALPAASPGDTCVFDLETSLSAKLTAPYDLLRFYLPAAALDRLADDQGLPRVRGLRTTPHWTRDPVMQGLALSIASILEEPQTKANRFLDSLALAFHAHVMRRYGAVPASPSGIGAGLAPWQLRRVHAFADANLDADPSIADLAGECRLSPSHFARAFSASTGTSPHKWLVNRRIERAKQLLLGGGHELSQIALACGFVDQSHFTRVFGRSEGESPGRWRRRHCSDHRPIRHSSSALAAAMISFASSGSVGCSARARATLPTIAETSAIARARAPSGGIDLGSAP